MRQRKLICALGSEPPLAEAIFEIGRLTDVGRNVGRCSDSSLLQDEAAAEGGEAMRGGFSSLRLKGGPNLSLP